MQSATDALFLLSKLGKISIKAKGLDIPNAVSIANIITDNFLKNNVKSKAFVALFTSKSKT